MSKASPENERGGILGLATSAGSLARFIGPLLTGVLYDLGGAAGAFYGGAAIMVGALLVAVRMKEARGTTEEAA